MNDHSHRWQSVAAAVAGRMREMGMLDNASLIRASGLSEPFVRGVLAGTPRGTPRRSSIVKLCTALGWTDSSIDQILAGADPTPLAVTPPGDDQLAALREQVERMAVEIQDLQRDVGLLGGATVRASRPATPAAQQSPGGVQ